MTSIARGCEGDTAAAYMVLRAFSWQLRLSPVIFESFAAAVAAPLPTPLMDEVHVCLLRALAEDETKEERAQRRLSLVSAQQCADKPNVPASNL